MTRIPDNGDAFEGIDPHLLAQLMTSLRSGVSGAQQLASSYLGQFGGFGLDTSRISRLLQDYGWAQGQQPMLQRRYDLASNQPSGQWVNGLATSGANYLEFSTQAQAQAAGAKAAQQLKDGNITYAQFYAELQEYKNDPDWATGAIKTLGPDGVDTLEREAATPDDPTGRQNGQLLAIAVAAAMANGVTFPDPSDWEHKNSENLAILAMLLPYASFPPQVLATLGREAMAPGNYMYGSKVWQALAANPAASALFVQQNAPYIATWIHAGDHGGGLPDDQVNDFLAVLKAGTVTIKATDPKLGGQAVTALVTAYGGNPGAHAPAQFEALYGQIVKDYWPDVVFALTAKASGSDPHGYLTSPDGMRLSPDQWAPFINEAMRDPQTGATLLKLAHAQGSQWFNLATQQPGGPDAGDSYGFDAGVVDGYFDYQSQTVYSDLVKERQDAGAWKDKVSEYIGDAVGTAFDVVADPGAAAKTITVAVTKQVITEALKFGVSRIPADGSPPPAPRYSTWQSVYAEVAANVFNNATPRTLANNPDLQALVNSATGQPFVVNGKVPDTATMTPQQLAAYNAWLSSPAVARYVIHNGVYAAWQIGYNASEAQQGFGG